jgi:hypothetical protein
MSGKNGLREKGFGWFSPFVFRQIRSLLGAPNVEFLASKLCFVPQVLQISAILFCADADSGAVTSHGTHNAEQAHDVVGGGKACVPITRNATCARTLTRATAPGGLEGT